MKGSAKIVFKGQILSIRHRELETLIIIFQCIIYVWFEFIICLMTVFRIWLLIWLGGCLFGNSGLDKDLLPYGSLLPTLSLCVCATAKILLFPLSLHVCAREKCNFYLIPCLQVERWEKHQTWRFWSCSCFNKISGNSWHWPS